MRRPPLGGPIVCRGPGSTGLPCRRRSRRRRRRRSATRPSARRCWRSSTTGCSSGYRMRTRTKLRAVLDRADDDDWRRRLRDTLRGAYDPGERQYLLRAPEAPDQPPLILGGLAYEILIRGTEGEEARALVARGPAAPPRGFLDQSPPGLHLAGGTPAGSRRLLSGGSGQPSREQSGAHHAGPSPARRRRHGRGHRCLPEGHPTHFQSRRRQGPGQGPGPKGRAGGGPCPLGRRVWKRLPRITTPGTATPSFAHSSATRKRTARARKALLERSGDSTDHWAMAERDSLACLLLPASGEELRRAVALVDRAVATGPKFPFLAMPTSSS